MRPEELDVWTPKLVGEAMIEAVRWARYNAGPTGPAPVRSLMAAYVPSNEDRETEGWGPPEVADPSDIKRYRRQLSPREVQNRIDALRWPAQYAVPSFPTSARILNLWLRCKVHKVKFGKVVKKRTGYSRAMAYRYRDKALSAIAQGLERDGVPLW